MLYAIIGMLVIIADQYIKFWVGGHIPLTSAGEEFIPGILSLVNVHNDGAAFGILSGTGARIPFIILAGVFTVAVIIALATKLISGKLARWSIVLVTAGGLSNCLDRVMYGYVQDMFKTEFINFPVFNLADIFITIFAIVFALAVIFGKTRKDDDDDYEFEDEEEEEEPRVSRRKAKRSKRRAARYEDEEEYDEEEDEEEEEPAPVRKPVKQKPVKQRRAQKAAAVEEEDAEEEPAPAPTRRSAASAAERQAQRPAPAQSASTKPAQAEDPFAGWERSSNRAGTARQSAETAKPAARASAHAAASARGTQRSAAAAKPTAKPTAKPASTPAAEEEFSLDDILNEFR